MCPGGEMSWEIPKRVVLGSALEELSPLARMFFWQIWDWLDERSRENRVTLDLKALKGKRKHPQPVHNALRELEDANLLTRPAGVGNQWGTVMLNPKYLHTFMLNNQKGEELNEKQSLYDREREVRAALARKRLMEHEEVVG